jgi:predicted alpha/beta superfamily hydrolase
MIFGDAPLQEPVRIPSATGDIRVFESFESKETGRRRRLQVWLPPGWSREEGKAWPVLILHDGQNVFDGATSYLPNQEWRADETADMLIRAGLVEPLIIAAIDNAGAERADEFLPTRMETPRFQGGGRADSYRDMLISEVLPFLQEEFGASRSADQIGVAGSSFGGILSLHIGMTRPDVFGRCAVFSPSLWFDEGSIMDRCRQTHRWPSLMWLDMGSDEGGAHLQTRILSQILNRQGAPHVYCEELGGKHNEAAWARRFGAMLLTLFPARARPLGSARPLPEAPPLPEFGNGVRPQR